MLVCLNGKFIPHESASLAINDGALLFGDSLFETLKARGQKILLQAEHLDRLELAAQLLDFPCDRSAIEKSLNQLARALTAPLSRIRLTLSRGQFQGLAFPKKENSWFLLTAQPAQEPSEADRHQGADCVIAPNQRVNPLSHLPQLKRGNYADCLYAANYARKKGAREALFIDSQGRVLEGSTSNLFALLNGRLLTPPTGNLVLAGVMRRALIGTATELGIPVAEQELNLEQLHQAQEVYLTNSLIDLLPVNSLDGTPLQRGEEWQELLKTLRLRIET